MRPLSQSATRFHRHCPPRRQHGLFGLVDVRRVALSAASAELDELRHAIQPPPLEPAGCRR